MSILRATWILLGVATAVAQAGEPLSATVFGMQASLADGSRALQLGDFETGVRLTLEGLKTERNRGNRARALSNLCAGYTALGEHDKALAACDEARLLSASNWRIYNNRALALVGLGRLSEARHDLEVAASLQPNATKLALTRDWIEAHAPRTVLADAN